MKHANLQGWGFSGRTVHLGGGYLSRGASGCRTWKELFLDWSRHGRGHVLEADRSENSIKDCLPERDTPRLGQLRLKMVFCWKSEWGLKLPKQGCGGTAPYHAASEVGHWVVMCDGLDGRHLCPQFVPRPLVNPQPASTLLSPCTVTSS